MSGWYLRFFDLASCQILLLAALRKRSTNRDLAAVFTPHRQLNVILLFIYFSLMTQRCDILNIYPTFILWATLLISLWLLAVWGDSHVTLVNNFASGGWAFVLRLLQRVISKPASLPKSVFAPIMKCLQTNWHRSCRDIILQCGRGPLWVS